MNIRQCRAGRSALGLIAIVAACSVGPPEARQPSPAPVPSSTDSSATVEVDVYYVIDTRGGLRLARERRSVPHRSPVSSAIQAMVSGADDPDYSTSWNPRTRVLAVERERGQITIDLSVEARRANVGSAGAALMIQQLVYTVTGAADATDRVNLLIEGEPAGELWGAVVWDDPVTRADPLEVRQAVQIDDPREGAVVTSPVTVAGEAAVFEGSLRWRVLDSSGRTVAAGVDQTREGQRFAPFRFEVRLEPGAYVLEVVEDDPSDGAVGAPIVDSRSVTVRRR